MKRVLIVYELVPEDTQLFDLAVTEDQFNKITKCHGHYMNPQWDFPLECGWLIEFLNDFPPVFKSSDSPGAHHTADHRYDAVVVTGYSF